MAVDSAISSIANSSSSYSATSKGKTSGSDLDKEAFLNLLVTQMQYQDPLNPSDNTEYMSQLAQYSALEAQLNISDTLDKGNNLNLVGKYVIMNTTDSSGKQAVNSYIFSPRSVTLHPIGIPSLNLKFATDFLARVTTAF